MTARTLGLTAMALTICSSALAGVVVLENGNVLVGEIRPQDVTIEAVIVRQPAGQDGEIRVPIEQVRWHDLQADEPTAEYWRQFPDAPIDPLYEYTRPRPDGEPIIQVPPPPPIPPRRGLSPLPTGDRYLQLRAPQGWDATRERGVTMLVSDRRETSDFRPRIHVFSVKTPPGSYAEQVGWIEAELAKLADEGGYEVDQLYTLKTVEGGADQRLVTQTRVGERTIVALRQIYFRQDRTYFFAAYAHEDDYQRVKKLFRQVLGTVKLLQES
jgi:hypothetical protein